MDWFDYCMGEMIYGNGKPAFGIPLLSGSEPALNSRPHDVHARTYKHTNHRYIKRVGTCKKKDCWSEKEKMI